MTTIIAPGYADFLAQLKTQIRQRQYQALRAVNHELVGLYWDLGQAIHTKQSELGWGKAVVQNLAIDLQTEFPGRNGFSAQNLWLMLQFFREYSDKPKLQPMVREISWAKNLVILGRCKDDLEREFYLRATARFGWTKAVLQHQVDNKSYQKYLLNQTNFDNALPEELQAQAALAVKDHYTFDFLELAEEHSERQLEQALVAKQRQRVFQPRQRQRCHSRRGRDFGAAQDRREVAADLERHDANHLPDSGECKGRFGALIRKH